MLDFLDLEQSKTRHKYKLGEEWLESSLADRDLGVLASSSWTGAARAVCLGSQEGKPHPSVYQTQHDQPVKKVLVLLYPESWCSLAQTLHAVLGPTVYKSCSGPLMCPEEGKKVVTALEGISCEQYLRSLSSSSSEKRRLEGWPHCFLQLPEEGVWRGKCWAHLLGIHSQDSWEWFKTAPGEDQISLLKGWSDTEMGFLERWSGSWWS